MSDLSSRTSGGFKRVAVSIRSPLVRAFFVVVVTFGLVLGFGLTAYWMLRAQQLAGRDYLVQNLPALSTGFALISILTLLNFWVRWLRWHFLIRRVGARVGTKDSLLIYLATMPALLTPFFIGELGRVWLLGKRHARYRFDVAGIWLMERSSDLLILCLFITLIRQQSIYVALSALLWLVILLTIGTLYRRVRGFAFPKPFAVFVLLIGSLIGGLLTGLSLWVVVRLPGGGLNIVSSFDIAAASSIFGYTTGLPSGIGISGSAVVLSLQKAGLGLVPAATAALVFRLGTVWFATLLGVIALAVFRKRLLAMLRADQEIDHFDRLSNTYDEELPPWIRDRLLTRKVDAMRRSLRAAGRPGEKRGLDVGCGQGWHTIAMARYGYQMFGIDQSEQQVIHATKNTREQGLQIDFRSASADKLPFEDNYFDFIYAINVIHHVIEADKQQSALQEIVRVLKPKGVFFLHEMNTINPLFRFYMGYLYPLIRGIDEGTEKWILPDQLPAVQAARWSSDIDYFTFLPDFVPSGVLSRLEGLERYFEKSRVRRYSAHYMARLIKDDS
ncbi:MAG: methyltransferase domain-containing protein [Deltaproteobacteria bacterium]|nr:methyltransferase domain-containing protein [Deltaproteobacteria bacterium]